MTLAWSIDRINDCGSAEEVSKCHRHGDSRGRHSYGNAEEQGYARKSQRTRLGSGKYADVEPKLENIGYYELLKQYDRRKGTF